MVEPLRGQVVQYIGKMEAGETTMEAVVYACCYRQATTKEQVRK